MRAQGRARKRGERRAPFSDPRTITFVDERHKYERAQRANRKSKILRAPARVIRSVLECLDFVCASCCCRLIRGLEYTRFIVILYIGKFLDCFGCYGAGDERVNVICFYFET